MTHYRAEDWAEFAVGAVSQDRQVELQHHLAGGCVECAQAAAFWSRVHELASREAESAPPESALHFARVLFRAFPRQETGNPLIQLARLVFDSRRAPAMAGVRSMAGGPSRFLFRGGNLILDVIMEPRSDDQPISLVGQVSDPTNPTDRCGNLPVSAVRDAGEVIRTNTNPAGEFQMILKSSTDLLLLVQTRNQSVLVSPLPLSKNDYC